MLVLWFLIYVSMTMRVIIRRRMVGRRTHLLRGSVDVHDSGQPTCTGGPESTAKFPFSI